MRGMREGYTKMHINISLAFSPRASRLPVITVRWQGKLITSYTRLRHLSSPPGSFCAVAAGVHNSTFSSASLRVLGRTRCSYLCAILFLVYSCVSNIRLRHQVQLRVRVGTKSAFMYFCLSFERVIYNCLFPPFHRVIFTLPCPDSLALEEILGVLSLQFKSTLHIISTFLEGFTFQCFCIHPVFILRPFPGFIV